MEKIKLFTIGQFDGTDLTIYHSHLTSEIGQALTNLDQDIDPNSVRFFIYLWLGEGPAGREIQFDLVFPFLVQMSEQDEVQNVLQAIQKFSTNGEIKQTQNDGRLWFFKGKLIWANRPARNDHDYDLICLRIEEHVYSENDEILRLKKRISRMRRIIDKDFQRIKRRQIDEDILAFVLQRDKNCCLCGAEEELQFDHILPVSKGGNDEPENLRILCLTCNSSRGNLENI